jgi:hypothetical protein
MKTRAATLKRKIRAAIDAHRPIFNSEIRPSGFEEQEAKQAVKAVYEEIDKLVALLDNPDRVKPK